VFEEHTYENILNRVLARVDNSIDKREGSVIYSAVAPVCAELAQAYIALNNLMDCTFADTAPREYMIKRAAERGLVPNPATLAKAIAVFNIDVDIGSRFSSEKFNWIVSKKISAGRFYITCETSGAAPNGERGSLIPIEYINGLETAQIENIEIYGEDEEDTEVFRQRYFSSFESQAFGGNKKDYYQKVTTVEGVGGCKVYRSVNSEGVETGANVLLVITNSEHGVANNTLVSKVQELIDPFQNQAGDGLAPIGHICHVKAADGTSINIDANIVYDTGFSFQALQSHITKAVDEYLHQLNLTWDKNDSLVVRISNIESRILAIEGVKDISDTKLNGTALNVVLDKNAIAVRGRING
jgi:baseplate J-like protein